jgi:hypothetical protein
MVRSGYIGIQIGSTEYVMPVSEANELIGMINRTQHEGVERQTAWVGLVSNCHRWAVHMDQWEKFRFDTEHGPIYVTIRMEEEHPDSFDRVSIIGQPLDDGKTT